MNLLLKLKRKKAKGERVYAAVEDVKLLSAAQFAYAVRSTLLACAKASHGQVVPVHPWFSSPERLEIDGGGKMAVMLADDFSRRFLDALCGENATRIRQCPQCQRLFRAKRKDKQVCSPACRVKRWRGTHSDDYRKKSINYEVRRAEKERDRDRRNREELRDRVWTREATQVKQLREAKKRKNPRKPRL